MLGCITSVKENSVWGKYHFNNYTQDLLLLDKNHNYTHRYVNSRGKYLKFMGNGNIMARKFCSIILISSMI
jgi:hypothetical protein